MGEREENCRDVRGKVEVHGVALQKPAANVRDDSPAPAVVPEERRQGFSAAVGGHFFGLLRRKEAVVRFAPDSGESREGVGVEGASALAAKGRQHEPPGGGARSDDVVLEQLYRINPNHHPIFPVLPELPLFPLIPLQPQSPWSSPVVDILLKT